MVYVFMRWWHYAPICMWILVTVYDAEVWGLSILLLGGTSQFNPCEWYMAKVMGFNKKRETHICLYCLICKLYYTF